MKRIVLPILIFLSTCSAFGQKLGQVSFLDGANLSYFTIITEQDVLIRINDKGEILEWGYEVRADRYEFYATRLQPFMARVDYYGDEMDSVVKGKVKSIGTTFITYYDAFSEEFRRGKIKTIGTLQFDYINQFEEKSLRGRLKIIGGLNLEYHRSYENEAYRGKVKAIGSSQIKYYSTFDDRVNAGKLKSIGSVPYNWYSVYDPPTMRGILKSNNYRQVISGVMYVLR